MPSDVLMKLKSDTGFKREYRVASLFGAGSGLPATLAMMDAVLQKGLETDAVNPIPTWISYVAIDGVSAGALVTAFLTHVNILNPVEVQHELRFIRNLSAIALQNNAFDLTKRMWAIFCHICPPPPMPYARNLSAPTVDPTFVPSRPALVRPPLNVPPYARAMVISLCS